MIDEQDPKDTGPLSDNDATPGESDVNPEEQAAKDAERDAAREAELEAEMEAQAEADAKADAAMDAARDAAEDAAEAHGDDEDREGVYSEEEARLIIAEAEVADLKDKLLRAVAETENVRRRAQRDQDDARKFAVTEFARDMLSVADNLQRAVGAVGADARENNPEVSSLLEGVELTGRELAGTLERHGIKVVDPMGEKLDPNLHQAVMQIEDPDVVSGTIVQVMQVGYVLNDRLLRPAMVGVAKGGPTQAPAVDETA